MLSSNVVLAVSFALSAVGVHAWGGISESCWDFKLQQDLPNHDQLFSATCQRIDGSLSYETIGLNDCFGNNEGWMQCGWSDFGQSCYACYLTGSTLNCACKRSDGSLSQPRVDLNS
ncbi:hypothetical protein EXIGLDRAFT_779415 [Exidia glandulosa HHB12029]|uniref:Cyanovirin-N domain-containing protein n=1 Tax=Exidia glandulosa HHB12029 TaxID=1314781 RepID=A0A165C2Q2_EXIGL|nr:hypothetical protein EXIGLDRAFT_779415 [Exidia glandulosa HHB12029]